MWHLIIRCPFNILPVLKDYNHNTNAIQIHLAAGIQIEICLEILSKLQRSYLQTSSNLSERDCNQSRSDCHSLQNGGYQAVWSWVFKSLKFWASTSYNLLENVKTLKRATRLPLIRFHLLLLIQGGCNPICICVIVWFSIFKVRLVLDKFVQLTLSLDGGAGDEPSWCLVFWVGLQINYYGNLSIISSIHREIR